MSNLAHSNQPTMDAIEFQSAIDDGEPGRSAGFWWIRFDGRVQPAEWKREWSMSGKRRRWAFHLVGCEEVSAESVDVVARCEPPDA